MESIVQGSICLITGATDGIGKATALELARRGATVVIVGRNRAKTEATVAALQRETGNPAVSYLLADLANHADIRRIAAEFKAHYSRLDVLINNAGALYPTAQHTNDGVEMTWAVNYLAPFILTNELLDVLQTSAPARIINLASMIYRIGHINLHDLGGSTNYNMWRTYARSKLAIILFTKELARRLAGTGVTANAVHPGLVWTNILPYNWFKRLNIRIPDALSALVLNPAGGAKTSVYLATSPDVKHISGAYFVNQAPQPLRGAATNPVLAQQLWAATAAMLESNRTI